MKKAGMYHYCGSYIAYNSELYTGSVSKRASIESKVIVISYAGTQVSA
jgi:hypothetical protein